MKHLKTLLEKTLPSRKFWLAVGAAITFGLAGAWHDVAMTLLAYAGVLGVEDTAGKLRPAPAYLDTVMLKADNA